VLEVVLRVGFGRGLLAGRGARFARLLPAVRR
jgi:hypothetical protein